MLTVRHSNEQGPKWMQNLSRINEPETIVNYRRQDDVFGYDLQFLLSGVLPVLQNLSYKAQITRSEVLRRNNTVIKSYTKCILALGGLHEDKLCGILHAIAPTTVEMALLTSIFHIESNPDRLGFVVAYKQPAFSAGRCTNYAPISFVQQTEDSECHISYRNSVN